jgi:hypothetical protein
MKPVKNHARKLAWTMTLAVAALMLPASLAHAQHGTSGFHAGLGTSGFSTHQGHHPYYGGYGFGAAGFYGGWGWGYGSYYGDDLGYGVSAGAAAANPYYGVYAPSPYYGVYTPFSGVSPFGSSTTYGGINLGNLFP